MRYLNLMASVLALAASAEAGALGSLARVSVVDRVPISENSAITIDLLPATTPPTDKTVADRARTLLLSGCSR